MKKFLRLFQKVGGKEVLKQYLRAHVLLFALVQTLLNMLNEEEENGRLTVWWLMEPGKTRIHVESVKSWKYGLIARTCFRMAVMGLKDIAEQYPEYIKIEEVEEIGIV